MEDKKINNLLPFSHFEKKPGIKKMWEEFREMLNNQPEIGEGYLELPIEKINQHEEIKLLKHGD